MHGIGVALTPRTGPDAWSCSGLGVPGPRDRKIDALLRLQLTTCQFCFADCQNYSSYKQQYRKLLKADPEERHIHDGQMHE